MMAQIAAKPQSGQGAEIEDALALHQQGRCAEAEQICSAILATRPDRRDAQHLLGILCHQQGRNVEALRLIGAVLKAAPRSADVLNNYGRVLGALSRHDEALARFDEALAVESRHIAALTNRAATLARLMRYEDALAAYEDVLAVKPDHVGALNECGGLNVRLGREETGLACYEKALAVVPGLAELHINKGTALRAMNRDEAALASFAAASAIEPDSAEALWNAGLVRLRRGDFAAGWKAYEWRWRKANWADKRRDFSAPLWLGEQPLEGKTILLHAEQGFGDTIQFVRYVTFVAGRGATVIFESQAALKTLLQNIEGVTRVVARGEPLPSFDVHCPLLSLPLAFGTQLDTVPNAVPYIKAPQDRLGTWANRLADVSPPRVGFVWSGNPAHLNDHSRSIPLHDIAPIFSLDGVQFVSLQKNAALKDVALLAQFSNVTNVGGALDDFADAAAAIAALDLVIAVDTAVAHLAGAMGKPVWVLLPFSPDFRWLLDRTDSPWYPTMRLFRQSAIGDWNGPLERVRQELSDLVAAPERRAEIAATTCG